ncbi:TIGR04282 family arsenosugar biosynthesis glycosyltransferase [candidate division KSB1 bacterium]
MAEIKEKQDQLLVVFLRNPLLGKVKKRIAAILGDKKAYDIYVDLLINTKSVCDTIAMNKAVFYSDFIDHADIWSNTSYIKYLQTGKDIGERMYHVFNQVLEDFEKVVLIGSDIPGINTEIINKAFKELEYSEIVLGPAKDGGYYLIGMKKPIKKIFAKKVWSTNTVLNDTLKDLQEMGKSYILLDMLGDVDTVNDFDELGLMNDKKN